MQKILITLILLIIVFNLSAASGEYSIGSMRVKMSFENNDPIYCYLIITLFDLELFKNIGIDDHYKMYKLKPMFDILPYLSDKVKYREVAFEIFNVPGKFSVVPKSKVKKYNSFEDITKIEFIEWMGRKGCEVCSFASIPDTDIEKIRKCDDVSFTKTNHGEFLSDHYYVKVNDKLPSWIYNLLKMYSYWEVYFNHYDEYDFEKFKNFYSHLLVMLDHNKNNKEVFYKFQVYEYFDYLRNYIESCNSINDRDHNNCDFDKDKLNDLYNKAIADNIVIFSISYD